MSARDAILARIKTNRPSGRHDLPPVPDFTKSPPEGVRQRFAETLKLMGGKVLERDSVEAVQEFLSRSTAVCSAVPGIGGHIKLESVAEPSALASVDIGVVRAAFGVAETGSVLVTETELQVNALAYLAQHLLVLLDPADIKIGLQHAYLEPHFSTARYASFNTGPSATADIEGVLIHGAQGVRSLTVAFVPRSALPPAAKH